MLLIKRHFYAETKRIAFGMQSTHAESEGEIVNCISKRESRPFDLNKRERQRKWIESKFVTLDWHRQSVTRAIVLCCRLVVIVYTSEMMR